MPFARRRSAPQPEPGQSIFSGREIEVGLYRLHFHREKDNPEVRLITAISGPAGVGKTRLLDELEWYRSATTIYSRIDRGINIGHDASQLLRALADGLHKAGEPIPTPEFDRLYFQRQELLEKALNRSSDSKQVLQHFHRPILLGLDLEQYLFTPEIEKFADLRWNRDELTLAFDNPIELMTQALVSDFNQALEGPSQLSVLEGDEPGLAEPIVSTVADKIVLMFDDFEHLSPAVAEWLLTYLLGHAREAINCDLRLVISGREELLQHADSRWATQFADIILALGLEPFTPAELHDFVRKNTFVVDDDTVAQIGRATDRLPLWLNVWLVSGADPTATDDMIQGAQGFSETERRWLEMAALATSFDQPRLTSLLGPDTGRTAFQWLVGQPMLVRAGQGTTSQFSLDRTLAAAILTGGDGQDQLALKQQLLDYLDEQLAAMRVEPVRPVGGSYVGLE
jgi:hypothetical protein